MSIQPTESQNIFYGKDIIGVVLKFKGVKIAYQVYKCYAKDDVPTLKLFTELAEGEDLDEAINSLITDYEDTQKD